ncbi:DUF2934 domain-containing protein [Tabrizicola aquatica]|uniref:DUF2934 domain-containing protein n=1 Tax=Tabrizicola aquatica TaxID=909926 RepID=UPI000CD32C60|nr:DUF2934 domain-containing protein [Tabrizicola aquatica]
MTQNQEARIRQRAYEIWLDEGAPAGRAEANWLQAQAELDREDEGPLWQAGAEGAESDPETGAGLAAIGSGSIAAAPGMGESRRKRRA